MDFKKISSDMPASLVVEFMNSTINHYDKIVQNYSRIFKVETKADGLFIYSYFVLIESSNLFLSCDMSISCLI
jgi:hypothetical protein